MLPNTKILALHGKMKDKRYKIFDKFRNLKSGLLICTDVMARGIDVPEVNWVLQYDPPSTASNFVHRYFILISIVIHFLSRFYKNYIYF